MPALVQFTGATVLSGGQVRGSGPPLHPKVALPFRKKDPNEIKLPLSGGEGFGLLPGPPERAVAPVNWTSAIVPP